MGCTPQQRGCLQYVAFAQTRWTWNPVYCPFGSLEYLPWLQPIGYRIQCHQDLVCGTSRKHVHCLLLLNNHSIACPLWHGGSPPCGIPRGSTGPSSRPFPSTLRPSLCRGIRDRMAMESEAISRNYLGVRWAKIFYFRTPAKTWRHGRENPKFFER